MLTYIPSIESLERFKKECRQQEQNLLCGKCQLCLDALLLMVPEENNSGPLIQLEEITTSGKTPLAISGDTYLMQLIRRCPSIKIIFPSNISYRGLLDLSCLESCNSLELVRIPFNGLTGTESIRQNLRCLVWIRGYHNSVEESTSSRLAHYMGDSDRLLRIDEIFWDHFGSWPVMTLLNLSQSNILYIDASSIPTSVKTLDLRSNRISQFTNLANHSMASTLTKLCLDHNSLTELPKLNANALHNLIHLSMRGNVLNSVVGLRFFVSLDYLDLSDNCICDVKNFLSEIAHLAGTLQTLHVEGNPISNNRSLKQRCELALYRLVKFNGQHVKRQKIDAHSSSPAVFRHTHDDLQPLLSEPYLPDFEVTSQSTDSKETTSRKVRKGKERIVVINDQSDEQMSHNLDSVTLPTVRPSIPKRLLSANEKNYFFGGVSGSYGSFNQLESAKGDASVTSVESDSKTRDDLGHQVAQVVVDIEKVDLSLTESKSTEHDTLVSTETSKDLFSNNDKVTDNTKDSLEDTSEWDTGDADDENMFFVEIYTTKAEYLKSLNSNDEANYSYFLRVRPHDGMIFEKDPTSGKILETLDLSILERYECMSTDDTQSMTTLRLFFDTSITSKQERIYCFLEPDASKSFIDKYLHNLDKYRNKGSSDSASFGQGGGKLAEFITFYMCLRCGDKTHRIITDCQKCGSEMIVKDKKLQSVSFTSSILDQAKSSYTTNTSSPTVVTVPTTRDNTFLYEENIDSEYCTVDETYFRSYINHDLKLRIEIYIYEKMDNEALKSESVEALCHCMAFNFGKRSFTPALVAITANFFFLFDHLEGQEETSSSSKKGVLSSSFSKELDRDEVLNLRFYAPLIDPQISHFTISHLPVPIKHAGYWIECKMLNGVRKKSKRKKNKFIVELVLFGDQQIGKAFLELLFNSQKICLRSQEKDIQNPKNLILVKSSITKLTNGEDGANDVVLHFDPNCQPVIGPDGSPHKSFLFFVAQSFQFTQNISANTRCSSSSNNLFAINDNVALMLNDDHIVLGEIFCDFTTITACLESGNNRPISKMLQEPKRFGDKIEVKMLFKELITNLLPNIYIDKDQMVLVMRFREDDYCSSQSTGSGRSHREGDSAHSHLVVYEHRVRFLSLPSLLAACRAIRSSWEHSFGVSLTITRLFEDTMA